MSAASFPRSRRHRPQTPLVAVPVDPGQYVMIPRGFVEQMRHLTRTEIIALCGIAMHTISRPRKPGTPAPEFAVIPQKTLAEYAGVSTREVRESLWQLRQDGVVAVPESGRGLKFVPEALSNLHQRPCRTITRKPPEVDGRTRPDGTPRTRPRNRFQLL